MTCRVGSLFSGVGGFDLGLERAGMECAWTVEYDKQARSVLRKHWPDVPHYEDVHDVGFPRKLVRERNHRGDCEVSTGGRKRELPRGSRGHGPTDTQNIQPVDLICGGFPCQDYSVAGKRGGLAGDRGALWWQMHRIIAECRPQWVVGENVPGLLSSNGGRDFLTIVASLVELGYGVAWATLDSKYFGVAQRRRRLFIVGHSGGIPRPEILALSEGLRGHPAPSRDAGKIASALPASGAGTSRTGNERTEAEFVVISGGQTNREITHDHAPTLNTNRDGAPVAFNTTQVTHPTNRSNPQPGDPCHTLAAGDHAPAIAFATQQTPKGFSSETVPTLQVPSRSGGGQPHAVLSSVPRRLTPVECERLQGFPDGWTSEGVTDEGKAVEIADGPRYRTMGNAVTVDVIEWIGRRIMETQ
jgi:DNA (cytosine-5)-methyltransferase 1